MREKGEHYSHWVNRMFNNIIDRIFKRFRRAVTFVDLIK
jgi:hypothetical protein